MAKYNVHAGHNPDGKKACGAVGLIKESTEARKVKDLVIKYLKAQGHTVYDCTVNDGKSASDVLKKIVAKCNAHDVDLDISIHFNAGANDKKGNGKSTGTEVLIYSNTSKAKDEATRICKKIASLGFKNRGVKVREELYVLRKTEAPALLVECCFVDDKDDIKLYDVNKMAKAIAEGILNKTITEKKSFKSYLVKVANVKKGDVLNIRAEPNVFARINGTLKYNDTNSYTIMDEKNGWGKLKSGVGWIKLSYTKKV